mgnify:CR=1 FL=1
MSKSGVSRLAEAVSWFEQELKKLYDEAISRSNELVRFSDEMARELKEDVEAALLGIIASLREETLKVEEALRAEYARRLDEELREIDRRSRDRFELAVNTVLEEVKRMALGVSSQ